MPGAPSAHQPYPLNREGENHAREAADLLEGVMAISAWQLHPVIDCSHMLRAWQTAHIIAEALAAKGAAELQLESFADLAERCVGSVANLTSERIRQIVLADPRYAEPPEDWKSNSEYRLPFQGAESLLEAGQRVAAHLLRRMSGLPADGADTLKLFVGHGAAFRHAAFHLGVLEYDQIKRLSMYHGRPVFLELLGDGSWRQVAGEWKIRKSGTQFND
jgi:broad specificity phosphatase PhoE